MAPRPAPRAHGLDEPGAVEPSQGHLLDHGQTRPGVITTS